MRIAKSPLCALLLGGLPTIVSAVSAKAQGANLKLNDVLVPEGDVESFSISPDTE